MRCSEEYHEISPYEFKLLALAFKFLSELAAFVQHQLMTQPSLSSVQLGSTTCLALTIQFSESAITFCGVYNLHTVTVHTDTSPGTREWLIVNTSLRVFQYQPFTIIRFCMSTSYLEIRAVLCTVLFRHENSKNERQKVLTSTVTSLLWCT